MNTNEMLETSGCKMEVICGKKWEELSLTEQDGIRFCGDCRKAVFLTTTPAELKLAAQRGLCVYVVPESPAALFRSNRDAPTFAVSRERIREIEKKVLQRLTGATLGVVKNKDV